MTYADQLRSDYARIRARLYNPPVSFPDPQPKPICRDVVIEIQKKPEPEYRKYEVKPVTSRKSRKAITQAKMHARRYNPKSLVPNPDNIPWLDIANAVTKATGVTLAEMQGDLRTRPIIAARMHLAYRLKTEIKLDGKPVSNKWIGLKINRDPSTIVHSIATHASRNNLPLPK